MQLKKKPYVIEGVIGNSKMLAALGNSGELYRLWWPQIGFPQHVNEFVFGLYVKNYTDHIIWLNDPVWAHQQQYIKDTNVLVTESKHPSLPLAVTVTDFCTPHGDSIVREVKLTSEDAKLIEVEFFMSASFAIDESTRYNAVLFDHTHDALVYYRHDYAFAVGSTRPCSAFEAGKKRSSFENHALQANEDKLTGHETVSSDEENDLNGNEIAMDMNGMMKWQMSVSNDTSMTLPIFISAGHSVEESLAEIQKMKQSTSEQWITEAVGFWTDFVAKRTKLNTENEAVQALYNRSILTFKLMSDKTYGSLIAAPEFDEDFTRCGGYAYCWGRDAAYITTAIDKAGYTDLVDHFYEWTLKAQSSDGSWQQRHFMDGKLAPQWGLQVDETGSILWGMWQHYLETNNRAFMEKVWEAVEKGANFLTGFMDPETNLPKESRDLWEERDGEHIYSAAAVYGGLTAAYNFAMILGKEAVASHWKTVAEAIKDAVQTIGWSEEKGHFLRVIKMEVSKEQFDKLKKAGKRTLVEPKKKGYTRYLAWEDDIVDISLLGLSEPFNLIAHDDPKMELMVKAIEDRLISPKVGGVKRYEDDHYIGGNPWILTTLWLSIYYTKRGNSDKAKHYFDWAVAHSTKLGLLPEQIDQETGAPAWVVPLTWSHAMFILAASALDGKGVL